MRRQWDELARLNAEFSISSVEPFARGDAARSDVFWQSGRDETDRLMAALDLGDTSRQTMVEIGCGIGRMTHALATRFGHVIALDVSSEMIARAREHGARLGNAEFRVSSGRDLAGIADASVDVVLAWFVLQHVPNAEDVLGYVRETGRVLRPGGKALLHLQTSRDAGDHARRWLERRLFYLLPLGLRLAMMSSGATSLEREFAARFPVWRGSFVRRSTAERVAREAGLTIVSAEPLADRYTVYTLARNRPGTG